MKIIKNEKLIKRNDTIGKATSIVGLAVLVGGMFISWQKPELFNYAILSLLAGFILTQVSIYMGNRFGRSPRPDETLDASLKGLPGDFTIYHYMTPVSHLIVGPAGLWIIMPIRQNGVVTYSKNRWKMSGGGFMQGYMRLFGQEGIGRPDLEAEGQISSLQKELAKRLESENVPPIQSVLVFTGEQVEVNVEDTPLPAVKVKQLKDFFRQKAKERNINLTDLEKIKSILPAEA